jgi:hypothetical protein
MSMPEPTCSPFTASPPTYSPHPATQCPVPCISVGSQTGHSSNLTPLRSEANSDDTGALPPLMLYCLLTWAFTLVDLPLPCQFVGGHVAHRLRGLRRFGEYFDLKAIAYYATTTDYIFTRSQSVSDPCCPSPPTLQIHLGSLAWTWLTSRHWDHTGRALSTSFPLQMWEGYDKTFLPQPWMFYPWSNWSYLGWLINSNYSWQSLHPRS